MIRQLCFAIATSLLLCVPVTAGQHRINDVTSHEQSMPAVAASGNKIFVAYQDTSSWNYDVRLSTSDDGGDTFAPSALAHEPSDQDQWQPAVTADSSGTAFIVWADYRSGTDFDIYCSSTADGENFSDSIRVNDVIAGTQIEPAVAVTESGDLFVAWADNRDSTSEVEGVRWDIYIAKSDDGGATFGPSTRLSFGDPPQEEYFAFYPEMAVVGDTCHIVWWKADWNLDYRYYRYTRTQDGGATFEPVVSLANNIYMLRQRLTAAPDGRIAMVWEDASESYEGADPSLVFGSGYCLDVYGMFSQDNGITWSPNYRINEEFLLNQQRPTVALTDDGWAVVWSDDRVVGDYSIRLATESWPPSQSTLPDVKIDGYTGDQAVERTFPVIVNTDDGLFVIWQDYSEDNYDLYGDRL